MWGIQPFKSLGAEAGRITPTYVGNTQPLPIFPCGCRDHPHVCGEYQTGYAFCHFYWGSPPRMWGILKDEGHTKNEIRITPTYVGNTCQTVLISTLGRDHPHVCGEYSNRSLINQHFTSDQHQFSISFSAS